MAQEAADLVIVGAGIYGIQVAKTFVQLHPDRKTVLLDAGASIGGTWAKERIYPGLKTNNVLGWFEFPDMPLTPDEFDVAPGHHIKSEVVHEYLEAYAKRFHVWERIRLATKVVSIEHAEKGREGWLVNWKRYPADGIKVEGPVQGTIHTSKLVLATGHTNEPLIPEFNGQDSFQKPLFHTRDWAKYKQLFESAQETVVLGGGKSAYDAAYMFAEAGIKTHMVIRASGHGPSWMSKYYATPLKLGLETLSTTRFIGLFSPCIWADYSGISGLLRKFLHGTWIGQKITWAFWGIVQSDILQLSGIQGHPGTERLIPWAEFFWSGTTCSILNHEVDFYQLVRQGLIEVHKADIEKLEGDAVILSTGERFKVDAFVCATSWKSRPAVEFLPAGSEAQLGLPHFDTNPDRDARFSRADEEVLTRFPILRQQPLINRHLTTLPTPDDEPFDPTRYNVPYLLYRFIVPPAYLHERSLALAGIPLCFHQGQASTAEALWISAYFDGEIKLPSQKEAERETVLHARHAKWRNPGGYGATFPDWIFDTLPFLDMVLGDVGVQGWRKNGLFGDIFKEYRPGAFKGLVEEYQGRVKRSR